MRKELINLLGGVPSITSTNTRMISRKAEESQQWVWCMFSNQARSDGFKLFHWQKEEEIDKDYEHAYYNNKSDIVDFTLDEYNSLIKPNENNWTYEETMHLWELITRFDSKFPVVYDRYDDKQYQPRTIEELKDRYYSISRKVLAYRKIHNHPLIKSGYNYEQEMKRKVYLERSMNRSNEEIMNEAHILKQAAEIEKKLTKYENMDENIKNNNFEPKPGVSFEEKLKDNLTENDSFVYLRSQKLKHALPISEKINSKVENLMKELNIPEKLIPTIEVEVAYNGLRNNVVFFTQLRKYLEKKEKEYQLLDVKLKDMQNKKNQHSQLPLSTLITGHDYDAVSVASSRTKEKKNKNNTPIKSKKVIIVLFNFQ